MNFFDELISKCEDAFSQHNKNSYHFSPAKQWEDTGISHIVLQRDTAFELNGTGFNLVTSKPIENSEITKTAWTLSPSCFYINLYLFPNFFCNFFNKLKLCPLLVFSKLVTDFA